MPEWVKIEPGQFNKPESKTVRGVTVEVYMSPYDVPEASTGRYDKDRKVFIIEFRYIGGEESLVSKETGNEDIALKIGKNTGRLYRIELDVDRMRAQVVGLQMKPEMLEEEVERAIDELAKQPRDISRMSNYKVAKQVIAQRGQALFADLVPA